MRRGPRSNEEPFRVLISISPSPFEQTIHIGWPCCPPGRFFENTTSSVGEEQHPPAFRVPNQQRRFRSRVSDRGRRIESHRTRFESTFAGDLCDAFVPSALDPRPSETVHIDGTRNATRQLL